MPIALSPNPIEGFHQRLMMDPTGSPPYHEIPTVARWHGDVAAMMNRLQRMRTSPQAGMQRQSAELPVGGRQQPKGRIAGDLTNTHVVAQSLERYAAGVRQAGRPNTPLSQAIHGSLLVDIYTVTGQFVNSIVNSKHLRTDNDCALYPLYHSLNCAAADTFGRVYGIDGDRIETCVRNQAIGMGQHGKNVDADAKNRRDLCYLKDEEALALRLHIKDGKFWISNAEGAFVKFDCSGPEYRTEAKSTAGVQAFHQNQNKGVAGFAMGHDRNIYARKHSVVLYKEQGAVYHSCYMEGQEVLCTGCITVVEGVLTYINNFSGHYEPSTKQLVLAVQALQAMGVNINNVAVQSMDNTLAAIPKGQTPPVELGPAFLKRHQGAGFRPIDLGFTFREFAPRIRAALAAYETRAKGFWSNPSEKSKNAASVLKTIPDNDNGNKELFEEVLFLLGQREDSPRFTPARLKLDNNTELAKQLRRAIGL